MKKLFKRLTVIMTALLVVFTSLPVFAANTGTITLHTGKHNVEGVQFDVYQMFSATVSDDQHVAYKVNADFTDFFTANAANVQGDTPDEKAFNYVTQNVTNKTFQDLLKSYIQTKPLSAKATLTGLKDQSAYTTTSLDYGYYVVVPSGDTYTPSFVTLSNTTQNVYLKGVNPNADKLVENKDDWASVQLGKPITFTVKSMVPYMGNHTTYTFKLVDTMTDGLTVTQASLNATVHVGNQKLTDDQFSANVSGQTVTIEILNFTNYKDKTNEEIIFTYNATLNEKALDLNADPNLAGSAINSANVHWGNNPQALEEGTPDEVRVVTHKLTIHKENDEGHPLENAIFELYKDSVDPSNQLSFVDLKNGTYRVAGENDLVVVHTITSPQSGQIVIQGLEAGTYQLKETEAPAGYNVLKEPKTITISEESTDRGLTITVDGNFATVTNTAGLLLPETGGMGTLLFTIVGTVGILLIAYSFVASKKKKD